MTYSDPTDPIDARAAESGNQATAPPPDDDRFAGFESERAAANPTDGAHTSTELPATEIIELIPEEDPFALFVSEVPSSPARITDDVPSSAPFPSERPVIHQPTRADRAISFASPALAILTCIIVAGGLVAIAIDFRRPSIGEQHTVDAPADAAATPGPPSAAGQTDDLLNAADRVNTEPPRPVDGSDLPRTMTPPVAAAPVAFSETTAERRTATAPVREHTATARSGVVTSEPSLRPNVMRPETTPVPPALPSSAAPDVDAAQITAALPAIAATVGTVRPNTASRVVANAASVVPATAVIESVLSRYAAAFSTLDVEEAKAVWPSLNERALVRAFDSVEDQQFDLGTCVIAVTPPSALASCDGTARYVPKVGSKRLRSNRRQWTFRLQQRADEWSIATVEFR